MKRKYWLFIGIAALVIFVSIIVSKKEDDSQNDKDKYALAVIKTIENKQLISGTISSTKEVNIKSELAGIIDQLYVNIGDEVKKGQPIAKIKTLPDPRSAQDAQRQINAAEINLERIKSNYLRNQSLYEKEVISKQEFEISQQEYRIAMNELMASKNYMKIVKQGFSDKSDFVSNIIYSTIDGVVLDVPTKIGGTIQNRNNFNEGSTIATIADMNEFIFKGMLNEKDLKHAHVGKKIDVQINALKGEKYIGNISRISPKGKDINGITRFDIEAKLEIKPTELYKIRSGFTASAEFVVEKVNHALSLEEKYIQYSDDTSYVYIKHGDTKKRAILETGISDGQYVEITKGLKKNDKVLKLNTDSEND